MSASYTTQVIIVVQGRDQSAEDYQDQINETLKNIKVDWGRPIVIPSAASDGRMTSIINYETILTKPKKEETKLNPQRI